MQSKLPLLVFIAAGIIAGGLINHTYSVQDEVAAGVYASTTAAPMTLGNTAIGAATGGIAAWLAGLSGLFEKIMAIIGIGNRIKDAIPPTLIAAISKMIKERKVDFTALVKEFANIDAALILSLVKELVSLVNGKLVTGPVDPSLNKLTADEPINIEIV